MDLPTEIPIFPLPGALLLPDGQLPLNIFEPRYLAMVSDAMGHGRIIGMIQPRPKGDLDLQADVDLFDVGCAGKIISFSETDDGRYLITLEGVSRFRIERELEDVKGYRRVSVADYLDLDPGAISGLRSFDRARLVTAMRAYLQAQSMEADWDAINGLADVELITTLAMACPFGIRENQALLEADDVLNRGQLLTELLEMSALASDDGDPITAH